MYALPAEELPMRLQILVLVALTACSSLDGVYTGECVIESSGKRTVYDVEVDITQSSKGGIDGDGEVISNLDSTISRGDVDGSRDGDDISFDIEFDKGEALSGSMSFDGTVDGAEIDGGCELNNLTGKFDLERED